MSLTLLHAPLPSHSACVLSVAFLLMALLFSALKPAFIRLTFLSDYALALFDKVNSCLKLLSWGVPVVLVLEQIRDPLPASAFWPFVLGCMFLTGIFSITGTLFYNDRRDESHYFM